MKERVGGLILLFCLILGDEAIHFSSRPSWKIHDLFSSWHERFSPPPAKIQDLVLVAIDSETIAKMKEKWPYSRATFAQVIERLSEARVRAIGLDFSFFGEEASPGQGELQRVLTKTDTVVFGATVREEGKIQLSAPDLASFADSGITNKLQDSDGVTRNALTYLVNTRPPFPRTRFFSWELKLLEKTGWLNLESLSDQGPELIFKKSEGLMRIPVESRTKSFLIRFHARSKDFLRLSFHRVLQREFDPKILENKIVLLGFLSELFQDIHRTPIGWLPGITLNANALLTLYAEDFLKPVPPGPESLAAGLVSFLALLWMLKEDSLARRLLWMLLIVGAFYALSYAFFVSGTVWNYFLLPFGVFVVTIFSSLVQKKRIDKNFTQGQPVITPIFTPS